MTELAAMFTLMKTAPLDVALQGRAHADRAARIAAAYVRDRKQGRQADGTQTVVAVHACVRRMLEEQECLTLTARAKCHIPLVDTLDGTYQGLAYFLTSLWEAYGSEARPLVADLGMPNMVGHGYMTRYGMAQILRDVGICAFYQGVTRIHANRLATRGLRPGGDADAFEELVMGLAKSLVDGVTCGRPCIDWMIPAR